MQSTIQPTRSRNRTFVPAQEAYVASLAEHVHALAQEGRGDDARGRHLASLYALEWAYRREVFAYRPTRDPARWLLLLVDVIGGRLALAPRDRLERTFGTFMDDLREVDLPLVAERTASAVTDHMGAAFGAPPMLMAPLVPRMRVSAILHALGVPEGGPRGREKHPQGRQIRKSLRASIDGHWDAQIARLEADRRPEPIDVLAAIPPSFDVTARTVQSALRRVGEDLEAMPFAVFYALLTDARRAGRVWRPPDAFVEGQCYDRATFDAAVGHVLEHARSRKRRYDRSCALAEMGLSTTFPRTVERIDRWLATGLYPEFCVAPRDRDYPHQDWYGWARSQATRIRDRHAFLAAAFERGVRCRRPD